MAHEAKLIIQLPGGSAVHRQLSEQRPESVAIDAGPTDEEGNLVPPDVGEVVLSVASPEALAREAAEVRRVVGEAGTGIEPLVVVVEGAEELRDDELAAVLDAAGRTPRAVILRIIRGI
jgi:regulator of extracellular matrix RemA (YlzA/DUF370 family)